VHGVATPAAVVFPGVEAQDWDRRYAGSDLVWGSGPNRWVEQRCGDLPPGRALDLACGEGRNALWLAARGWRVTAVDFSRVALDRGAELAAEQGPQTAAAVEWVCADLLAYDPEPAGYDLVVVTYLQLPAASRREVVRRAVRALASGGRLVVVAHDSTNLTEGSGGPQDPRVLYTAADVVSDLSEAGAGLIVETAEAVRRTVDTSDGRRHAIDALLVAIRA
jgi:SAM-dependent methyltransferase